MTAKSVLESATGDTAPGTLSQAAITDDDIKRALAQLDPGNPTHWTADGKPAMAALNALLPAEITRARLEEVAPDFVRPTKPADAGTGPTEGNYQGSPEAGNSPGVGEQAGEPDPLEKRLAALEGDLAFLRALFGWPTKGA